MFRLALPVLLLGFGACRADDPATRGLAHLDKRENEKAVAAFNEAIKAQPGRAELYDRRGDAYLKLSQFKEAVSDFDAFLKAQPKFAPEHWRRGIALYYLGRYEDGVRQFETHKTVNPEDVENAAWHYLCNVHVVGKDKAKAALIEVTRDRRVPMAEIQKLFAGSLKPEDVLAAAEKTDESTPCGTEARFYANLYVGLWYESEKDVMKRDTHLAAAVEKYKIGHYMWDVGNAHVNRLKSKP
jgi:lipoprotein NlpI